ncbi:hypothetical protein VTN00DRAFT_8841 [Thermoascus crustaceus]|uniref:uncharacterized protein n=1 Tax=Thermoascus crustaceus TaxID=5088 RepID=UPI0037426FC2
MEGRLSALRLRDQAGDLPHDEDFYPKPRPVGVHVMTDDHHDGHDPDNEFSGELPGDKAVPKDLPLILMADKKKIIECRINTVRTFQVKVINEPDDFEEKLKAEEAAEEAKRNA